MNLQQWFALIGIIGLAAAGIVNFYYGQTKLGILSIIYTGANILIFLVK